MSVVTLHRTDPARNTHRFYRLDVQPDLFGEWCVVREWGRIGQGGQMRVVPYPTMIEAQAALDRQRRIKERRGYVVVRVTSLPAMLNHLRGSPAPTDRVFDHDSAE